MKMNLPFGSLEIFEMLGEKLRLKRIATPQDQEVPLANSALPLHSDVQIDFKVLTQWVSCTRQMSAPALRSCSKMMAHRWRTDGAPIKLTLNDATPSSAIAGEVVEER